MIALVALTLILANGSAPRAVKPQPHVLLITTARNTTRINYPSRERCERARDEAIRQHSKRSPEGFPLSGVYDAYCLPL